MWHLFTYNHRNSNGKIKNLHIDFVIKRIELGFLEENYSVGRVNGTTPFFFFRPYTKRLVGKIQTYYTNLHDFLMIQCLYGIRKWFL